MELDDILGNLKGLTSKIDEIKKLYDVGEAEMVCLMQMSMLIKMLGFSPELRLKLLKALSAIDEMIIDELRRNERNTK